jgi:GNAT superfamily N-acetyltransferase
MDSARYFAAIDNTWPARRIIEEGPWTIRDGDGGGKRVSAATARGPVTDADIGRAEAAMRALGLEPLFQIRPGDQALDNLLAARGYRQIDPSVIHGIDAARLTDTPVPRVTVFAIWEPLAIMSEIWAAGGIGPARLRVMERASAPRTALFGRQREMPAGVAFVAIHDGIAMLHALEILPHQRRQGMAVWMMRAAAFWAVENGATTLSVICTRANGPANALYASLGFSVVEQYHYRQRPKETT